MGRLSDKRALVTGAGMGIGQGIARALAREGVQVAVHYTGSKAGAEEDVAEITRDGGVAVPIPGDLRTASAAVIARRLSYSPAFPQCSPAAPADPCGVPAAGS